MSKPCKSEYISKFFVNVIEDCRGNFYFKVKSSETNRIVTETLDTP